MAWRGVYILRGYKRVTYTYVLNAIMSVSKLSSFSMFGTEMFKLLLNKHKGNFGTILAHKLEGYVSKQTVFSFNCVFNSFRGFVNIIEITYIKFHLNGNIPTG